MATHQVWAHQYGPERPVEDAAHLTMLERPMAFNDAVADFTERVV